MIINHDNPKYRERWNAAKDNKYNGAFYYSKEICKNIIPLIDTDRNWITINQKGEGCDYAIVFIHNNLHPDHYDWLQEYTDLILVCGVRETCKKVKHLGKTIYLPLSVDVDYVKQFKTEKTKDTAYVGRKAKMKHGKLPSEVDFLYGMKRQDLLPEMAKYKKVYAVGRCAIEAKILGCKVLPFDERYPNPNKWKILDNREAAKILQEKLDKIDKKGEK